MPRRPTLNFAELGRLLVRHLDSRSPTGAVEIATALGVSRATVTRLLARDAEDLLAVGRARARRYARRRRIDGVGSSLPVYEIDLTGTTRKSAVLHAVMPRGFYVESATDAIQSAFHADLPYYLHELRPSGFLGRLLPRRHPDLELPLDIQRWSTDHCLKYLTRYGWNLPGNFVVGDRALEGYLASLGAMPDGIERRDRPSSFARLADDVLARGAVGSSAAGEQPKFLATVMPEATAVLVKFSPPRGNPIAERSMDLLVAEHVVHEVLRSHGHESCLSELVPSDGRLFLQVERFDRVVGGGRRGIVSLLAVDAEAVGSLESWSRTAEALAETDRIAPSIRQEIRWREQFGHLIANTDMHFGNLSFFTHGENLLGLTPSYDMLPMLYAQVAGNLRTTPFTPPTPNPASASVWETAHAAARDLWSRLATHELVSVGFRAVARANRDAVDRWADIARKLPLAR